MKRGNLSPLEHRQRLQFDHDLNQITLVIDDLADVFVGPGRLFEIVAVPE